MTVSVQFELKWSLSSKWTPSIAVCCLNDGLTITEVRVESRSVLSPETVQLCSPTTQQALTQPDRSPSLSGDLRT